MDKDLAPLSRSGTRNDALQAVLFVKGNGIGVDPRSGGAGVGVGLVKRLLEVHSRRAWIDSEGKGKGSMFCFTLPIKE